MFNLIQSRVLLDGLQPQLKISLQSNNLKPNKEPLQHQNMMTIPMSLKLLSQLKRPRSSLVENSQIHLIQRNLRKLNQLQTTIWPTQMRKKMMLVTQLLRQEDQSKLLKINLSKDGSSTPKRRDHLIAKLPKVKSDQRSLTSMTKVITEIKNQPTMF